MSSTYIQVWRCLRCDVGWAKDAGMIPCWCCGSTNHVTPSVDECVEGGILDLPSPAPPMPRGMRGLPAMRLPADGMRGLPADIVVVDEVHEWAAGVLEEIANTVRWEPRR